MNTSFSHALRVLICPACGGTLHVAVEGGTRRCEVCDEEHEVAPRPSPDPGGSFEGSEEERLARLRGAEATLPPMPEEVKALTRDGGGAVLRADAGDEALALWQETRLAIEDRPKGEAPRKRFFHLTMLLYRRTKSQQDDLQLRGILESAVELAQGHRDEQIFRCVLARAAVRAEDVAAAEDWLAECEPRSPDLHADGAYRYTAALLATHAKRYDEVLELLGTGVGDVPLAHNLDVSCSVLRANAHERLGRLDAAVLELADCMSRASGGPGEVDAAIRSAGDLVLCRESYVRARHRHDELTTGTTTRAPADPSRTRLKRAVPWVVLSLFFLGLAAMTTASSRVGGYRLDALFLVISVAFAVPLAVLFLRKSPTS